MAWPNYKTSWLLAGIRNDLGLDVYHQVISSGSSSGRFHRIFIILDFAHRLSLMKPTESPIAK